MSASQDHEEETKKAATNSNSLQLHFVPNKFVKFIIYIGIYVSQQHPAIVNAYKFSNIFSYPSIIRVVYVYGICVDVYIYAWRGWPHLHITTKRSFSKMEQGKDNNLNSHRKLPVFPVALPFRCVHIHICALIYGLLFIHGI